MGGMNSGLSQNAIIADVIVDVALWGVTEYGDDVGQAVGAMVGSGGDPAGIAIGKNCWFCGWWSGRKRCFYSYECGFRW